MVLTKITISNIEDLYDLLVGEELPGVRKSSDYIWERVGSKAFTNLLKDPKDPLEVYYVSGNGHSVDYETARDILKDLFPNSMLLSVKDRSHVEKNSSLEQPEVVCIPFKITYSEKKRYVNKNKYVLKVDVESINSLISFTIGESHELTSTIFKDGKSTSVCRSCPFLANRILGKCRPETCGKVPVEEAITPDLQVIEDIEAKPEEIVASEEGEL